MSLRQWIGLIVVYLFIPLVLLVCGGDFGWWQAWIYSLLIVAAGVGWAYFGGTAASGIIGRTTKY